MDNLPLETSPSPAEYQAQVDLNSLLTHRLVEARMLIVQQAQYIVDLERRMAEANAKITNPLE